MELMLWVSKAVSELKRYYWIQLNWLFFKGPAVGYLSASFLLSKWINVNEQAPVSENDSRWVFKLYCSVLRHSFGLNCQRVI